MFLRIHDNYYCFIHLLPTTRPAFVGGGRRGRDLLRGGYTLLCHSSPSTVSGGAASVQYLCVLRENAIVLYLTALLLQTKVEQLQAQFLSSRVASPAVYSTTCLRRSVSFDAFRLLV
jgi:hypothetical protein